MAKGRAHHEAKLEGGCHSICRLKSAADPVRRNPCASCCHVWIRPDAWVEDVCGNHQVDELKAFEALGKQTLLSDSSRPDLMSALLLYRRVVIPLEPCLHAQDWKQGRRAHIYGDASGGINSRRVAVLLRIWVKAKPCAGLQAVICLHVTALLMISSSKHVDFMICLQMSGTKFSFLDCLSGL